MNGFESLAQMLLASDTPPSPNDLTTGLANQIDPTILQTLNRWLQQCHVTSTTIDELSPVQESMIEIWRSMWVALSHSCKSTNRVEAEESIALIYESAGFSLPTSIIWVESPRKGVKVSNELLTTQKATSIRSKVWNLPAQQADHILKERVAHSVREKSITDLLKPVRSQGWGLVGSQIELAILADPMINAYPLFLQAGYGSQDSHWLAQYSFFSVICQMNDLKSLKGHIRLAQDCWWWWAFENYVVISEKPTELHVESGSLVNIKFADGTGLCF